MAALNPYLNFNGNTEDAFNFYKSVFGGEFLVFQRFKDVPAGVPMPEGEGEMIMHVALPLGNGSMLMGSDVPSSFPPASFGTNVHISINTSSEAETEKLFNGLTAGGQVLMPLEKTFWGAYFGMFKDKFGVHWMVNYDYNQNK